MRLFLTIPITLTALAVLFFSGGKVIRYSGKSVEVIYDTLSSVEEIRSVELDCSAVKPVVYKSVVSLEDLPVTERKEAFIKIVLPSVLIADLKIKRQRGRILEIKEKISEGISLSDEEALYLSSMLEKYRTDNIDDLLFRLNTHPPSVILAQAALESGWGSSRFFSRGNNLFGTWTYQDNSGIMAISSGVRLSRYHSILESVEDYLYNINVSRAYRNFRKGRAATLNPFRLINHLYNYSTLKREYVRRLNRLLRSANLETYDNCRIDPAFIR